MIQRIQTVWALAATVAAAVLFFVDMGQISGPLALVDIRFNGVVDASSGEVVQSLFPLTCVVVMCPAATFLSIFLFNKRPLQIRVMGLAVALCFALAAIIILTNYLVASDLESEWNIPWAVSMPLVAAVLMIMARRGVWKDEMLVRSLSRLR